MNERLKEIKSLISVIENHFLNREIQAQIKNELSMMYGVKFNIPTNIDGSDPKKKPAVLHAVYLVKYTEKALKEVDVALKNLESNKKNHKKLSVDKLAQDLFDAYKLYLRIFPNSKKDYKFYSSKTEEYLIEKFDFDKVAYQKNAQKELAQDYIKTLSKYSKVLPKPGDNFCDINKVERAFLEGVHSHLNTTKKESIVKPSLSFRQTTAKHYILPLGQEVAWNSVFEKGFLSKINNNKTYSIHYDNLSGKSSYSQKLKGRALKELFKTPLKSNVNREYNIYSISDGTHVKVFCFTTRTNAKSLKLQSSRMPISFTKKDMVPVGELTISKGMKTIRDICNKDNVKITNKNKQEKRYRARHSLSTGEKLYLNMSKPGVGLIQMTNEKGRPVNSLVFHKVFK